MPSRRRPCASGCGKVTSERFCESCSKQKYVGRTSDRLKGSASSRGYDNDWRKIRLVALRRDNYLCQICLKTDRPTQATDVDHIISIKKAPERRLDLSNLQSLCKPCHIDKSREEDGFYSQTKEY